MHPQCACRVDVGQQVVHKDHLFRFDVQSFQRQLKDVGIVDLLRRLNTDGHTAKLTVTRSSGPGELVLCLHKGEIVFAKLGDLFGAEAIYGVAEWIEGQWTIDSLKENDLPDANVKEPFEDILMECCRIMDSRKSKEQPA